MKTNIIIQARMWSTRLPWKVMLSLAWKPVLWHVVERCKKCKNIDDVIIATTTNSEDDIIERWCINNNVKYYRWSSDNVLNRYYNAAKKFKSDNIVRITSDCPLIEPEIIDNLIKNFDYNKFDYKTICINWLYPRWLDCEIFTFNSLKIATVNSWKKHEKEHVTPYIVNNLNTDIYFINEKFSIDARLTLDTLKDYELISYIYDKFYKKFKWIDIVEVIAFLRLNKDIKDINKNILQKSIYD